MQCFCTLFSLSKQISINRVFIRGEEMNYRVFTPEGFFEVIQQLTYGDMIIASILIIILAVIAFKVIYDIADREGFI